MGVSVCVCMCRENAAENQREKRQPNIPPPSAKLISHLYINKRNGPRRRTRTRPNVRARHTCTEALAHSTHHDLILKQKSHRRTGGPHSKDEKGDTAKVTQRGKRETAEEKKTKEQETENRP